MANSRGRNRQALAFASLVLIRITVQGWGAAAVVTRLGSRATTRSGSLFGGVARTTAVFTAQRPEHVAC